MNEPAANSRKASRISILVAGRDFLGVFIVDVGRGGEVRREHGEKRISPQRHRGHEEFVRFWGLAVRCHGGTGAPWPFRPTTGGI
jgi:hypothetical protein